MTEICCFNQDNFPILSVPRVIFTGSRLVALLSRFVGHEMRMQTWRWTGGLLFHVHRVCVVATDRSSDSSDCHMVKVQNAQSSSSSSSSAAPKYNVTVEPSPSPESEIRTSSSTLQDEQLTGSYTVSSSPCNDYNVRTSLLLYSLMAPLL